MTAERILIIDLAGAGDLILATPALRAVRAHWPDSHVAVLVGLHAAHILDHCPYVDDQWVLASPRAGFGWWLSVGWDQAILQQLRAQRFTLALNMHDSASWPGSMRMAYYLRHMRPERSIGYTHEGRGWCYSQAVPQTRAEMEQTHEAMRALRIAQAAGCPPVELRPRLWVGEDERAQITGRLRAWGCSAAAPLIILNPGASHPAKRWPVERFAALAQWLASRARGPMLVVGDLHDQRIARALAARLPGAVIDITGHTTVRELLTLISVAALIVTNDTGTMHMAAALGTPLVALIGPTNLARFAPLGDPARQRVLQPSTRRLEDLEVAEVQQAVNALLGAG